MQDHKSVEIALEKKSKPILLGILLGIALGACATFGIVVCKSPYAEAHPYATVLKTPEYYVSADLITYLQGRSGKLIDNRDGTLRIMNTTENRRSIQNYMSICRERYDLCSCNLANRETTHDEKGMPQVYRAKYLKLLPDGSSSVEESKAESIHRYEPGHPDADKDGYVAYPNINAMEQLTEAAVAIQQHEFGRQVLMQFDPSLVLPSLSNRPDLLRIAATPIERTAK